MLGSKSLPWEQKAFSLLISNDSVSEEIKCISKTAILSRSSQGQFQLGLSFSAPTDIWGWIILCWGSCLCIAGCSYPFHASCAPPQLWQLKMSAFIVTCENLCQAPSGLFLAVERRKLNSMLKINSWAIKSCWWVTQENGKGRPTRGPTRRHPIISL